MSILGGAPAPLRRAIQSRDRIVIRRFRGADMDSLRSLAALTDRQPPDAPLLLAEADGRLIAALSTRTGDAVTDPFVVTNDVVALLRLRAAQLDRAA